MEKSHSFACKQAKLNVLKIHKIDLSFFSHKKDGISTVKNSINFLYLTILIYQSKINSYSLYIFPSLKSKISKERTPKLFTK